VRRAIAVRYGIRSNFDHILRHFGIFPSIKTKKADVAEHSEMFDHVGLLDIKPPGIAYRNSSTGTWPGCSISSHPITCAGELRPIGRQLFHHLHSPPL
jgi:hypothetical protein